MAMTLRTLDTTATLAEQQLAIRQAEALGFRVLSLTVGRAGGGQANLVTFVQQAGAPAQPITLEPLDGALDQNAQEAALNAAGRQVVCYGSLYVQSAPQNVMVSRS
jgi:hypothetical protein